MEMEQELVLPENSLKGFPFDADIVEILHLGLEINHIVVLSKLLDREILPEHPKVGAWIQTLERKGYIDKSFNVTTAGCDVITALKEKKTEIKKQLKPSINVNDAFERWWKAYPATDTFIHKGKRFIGSRSFKNSKDKCKALLAKILIEGKYTIDQLIDALEEEIKLKKDKSVKENKNNMMYMKNTHAYLFQREFEGFIEAKKTPIIDESTAPTETFSI
jgi:DNA-binding MarR family transcriptional regulator